ncbi:MAG: hypothetical protein V2A62_03890 [Candidatus Woesearchaeota archaeon]
MQKRIGLYLLIGLLLVSFASATIFDDLDDFKNNLGIDEPLIILLVRVAILILITVLLFEALSHVGLSQHTAGIVSFILALISVVLIPGGILIGIASTYGTLLTLILLLVPIGALMFIVYVVIPGDRLIWRVVRIILILVVIWLLFMFKSWVSTNL